jgi:hypothetical protein
MLKSCPSCGCICDESHIEKNVGVCYLCHFKDNIEKNKKNTHVITIENKKMKVSNFRLVKQKRKNYVEKIE